MKRLIALFIGITIGTSAFTACSSETSTTSTTSTSSTTSTTETSVSEKSGREIVENAFEKSKSLKSYDIEISLINVLNSPDYYEQSLVRKVNASYIVSPTAVHYFSTDIYGAATETVEAEIYIREEGAGLKSYYNDSLYGWIIEDVYETDIPGFLFDQSDTMESFLKLGTKFEIVEQETVDGKEVYTVEMYGNIDLMKELMGSEDSTFDAYMREAGDFFMTVKCTDDAIIEYDMDFTDLYNKIADAIDATEAASEDEVAFAEIYRISDNSYNIKLTNVNSVQPIDDPEGIEKHITYDEAWEIYQKRMTEGIQPEDIIFDITGPEGAAALENSEISIYYPDTDETVVLQAGTSIDEYGNRVNADGEIVEESGVGINVTGE